MSLLHFHEIDDGPDGLLFERSCAAVPKLHRVKRRIVHRRGLKPAAFATDANSGQIISGSKEAVPFFLHIAYVKMRAITRFNRDSRGKGCSYHGTLSLRDLPAEGHILELLSAMMISPEGGTAHVFE